MTNRNSKFETRRSPRFSSFEFRISAVIFALAGLLMGCRSKPPSGPVDAFPVSNSVPGWVKSSETRTFEPSQLWQYIDGDADKYVQAGVVKTLTSDYRFKLATDATVDVYVMGDGAGARKIYDSESAVGSQPLTIGDAGRYAKVSLTFRQGPYFVRLVAYEDSSEMVKALEALARALSAKLNASPASK
ncbi:MAG: DUF6599 family protein [Terriglobia bacterium]